MTKGLMKDRAYLIRCKTPQCLGEIPIERPHAVFAGDERLVRLWCDECGQTNGYLESDVKHRLLQGKPTPAIQRLR
jgi:hypothetical protein